MTKEITLYDDAGRITCIATLSEETFDFYVNSGRAMVVGVHGDTELQYVVNEHIVQRPASPAVLTGLKLERLPTPCLVIINGAEYPCDEGVADLEFTYPATYKIIVRAFPYLDATFEVVT
ncbi:hypothetical protein [Janthinobacterium sp. CG3]|uniref:hypothetical protein n=1 Tax=Janthinobacterium sp. CG3 TaxID=1075768 RepID=UPI0003790E41|nr:hypothetical protein [Janthinobacterium sp. CG3]